MDQQLIIPRELPGLNEVISASKSHYQKYASMKRRYTDLVSTLASAQLQPVDSPVSIHIGWYCKNRRGDPDNVASAKKFVIDGLVKAKILPDDSWRYIAAFVDQFFIDKQKPRVEVTIEEAR